MGDHLLSGIHPEDILPPKPLLHKLVQTLIIDSLAEVGSGPHRKASPRADHIHPHLRLVGIALPIISLGKHQRDIGVPQDNPIIASETIGAAIEVNIFHSMVICLAGGLEAAQETFADIPVLKRVVHG